MNVELDKSFFIRTFTAFVFALVIQSKVLLSIPLPKVGATILTDAKHEHPTRGGNYLLMEEIWKDIPNYEGKYQVSNKGRVKSMARRAKSGIKNGLTHRPVNERILKPSITKGYYMVVLSDKTRHAFTVHGLVARVFIGPRNGFVVDHIDGNKLNNELVNLEYVSPTENSLRYRRAAKSSSVYVGVSKRQNKTRAVWQANIQINNKKTNLGIFLTEEEAHEAYQKVRNSVIDKKYTNEY